MFHLDIQISVHYEYLFPSFVIEFSTEYQCIKYLSRYIKSLRDLLTIKRTAYTVSIKFGWYIPLWSRDFLEEFLKLTP